MEKEKKKFSYVTKTRIGFFFRETVNIYLECFLTLSLFQIMKVNIIKYTWLKASNYYKGFKIGKEQNILFQINLHGNENSKSILSFTVGQK